MKVAIIGGTGYGAVELIRFLQHHPHVEIAQIISHSQAGTLFSDVYPHVNHMIDKPMDTLSVDDIVAQVELVFFATPPSVSCRLVPQLLDAGVKCIDLSGDFRLNDPNQYQAWYGSDTAEQTYLDKAVYGLSEVYRDQIANAQLIANPGCYPTAILLGLMPIVEQKLISPNSVIIDGKTGVSGAGRSTSLTVHFSEMNENTRAYKIGNHKHIPEIEQSLSEKSEQSYRVHFTPHIVPMTRGIMTTIYADLNQQVTQSELEAIYHFYYQDDHFVRVRTQGGIPATKEVYGSNYCDLGIFLDQRTQKLTVIAVIDNLVKGAAGQAVQNMNIMYGWDEQTGLAYLPVYP
ncbi:N-acetyl-gamma-glutamyl-phosphate reductase [Amphibacillus cookii]|uniref:N-acetyl-gamma-glutamyl-phosphate reductase n=1 Tax=Amphibacillus cookii TaxID=767787 RepID=UPI00195E6160|nr:N-acetyl-gamma-glutamyl-phosphate reductase [Amphibacillus cookii]MBM7540951.1 N-acetyl-gamma-glutamyl-phosphate reductase [Amphibacillus cookii]